MTTIRSALLRAASLACVALALGCAGAPRARPQPPAKAAEAQLTTRQLLDVAAVLEARGDSLRASQYLSLALGRGADPSSVVPRLLALYVRDGQYRLALDLADNHLRRHPRDLRTRFVLGSLYLGLGMLEQAAAQYARVIDADPERADAHFALASLLREQGQDLARADALYRAYLRIEPEGRHAEEARAALLTELP